MSENPLYPAYQKYYSALKCLEQLKFEESFFDNISSFDTFFSEYRSTTLVLKAAIAHTQYEDLYQSFPVESWDPFFNKQRVQTIHVHPTEILKTISLDMYLPGESINVLNHTISIEEDVPLPMILDAAKSILEQFNLLEVFFSAKFSVIEKNSGIDLWERILDGLSTMHQFMEFMYSRIDIQCQLCEQLRSKIRTLDPRYAPGDFATVVDYAYYPKSHRFERASRIGVVFGSDDGPKTRIPVSSFGSNFFAKKGFSYFEKFVLIHAIMPVEDFMPTIMIVYVDESFSLDTFHSELKTTFYRKVNEVAHEIESGKVREVFLLVTYLEIDEVSEELTTMTAAERSALASSEHVVFSRLGDDLEEIEYSFTLSQLHNPNYVYSSLRNPAKSPLYLSKKNLTPIVEAFKRRAKQ